MAIGGGILAEGSIEKMDPLWNMSKMVIPIGTTMDFCSTFLPRKNLKDS